MCIHFCADCVLEQRDFCYRDDWQHASNIWDIILLGHYCKMQMCMQESLINDMHIHTSAEFLFFSLLSPHQWGRLMGYGDRGSKEFGGWPSSDPCKVDKHSELHRDITTYGDMETFVTRHRCKQPKLCPTLPPWLVVASFFLFLQINWYS